jgi:carbon-monoxide dehydrogenase large subunit
MSAGFGAGSLVGAPVRRVEDPTLLRGEGTFVDNLDLGADLVHLAFVRSPIAHAEIGAIDVEAARAMPGVVGVWTAADLDLPVHSGLIVLDPRLEHWPLAKARVRYVGDAVAVVAATSRTAAVDATEQVVVEYDALTAVVGIEHALDPASPVLFPEVGSNAVYGKREADDYDPLAGADVVVRGRFENQRIAVAPMEGQAVAVLPGHEGDEFALTVYLGCQSPHSIRAKIAKQFGLERAAVRLVAPHVGGSFGGKHWSPEGVVAARLALDLGRPVKWIESRSEDLLSLPHGRAQVQYVELGLTADGTFVGLRTRVAGDAGAYGGMGGMFADGPTRSMAQGVYRIPKVGHDGVAVVTNTTPVGAYRGAGRPEAAAMIERIVDMAADELGIDPAELRRRNFIPSDAFPFATAAGQTYDIGDYDAALTEALRIADYDTLLAEQAERRARGDRALLGIGLCTYVEITAQAGGDYGAVEVHPDGTVTVKAGTSAHGQGHATAYSQIVAGELGIPIEHITFVQSDTSLVPRGNGTGGSRSLQIAGSAVLEASRLVLDRARSIAAIMLEAAPEDVVVTTEGRLAVAGVPTRSFSWAEVAATATEGGEPLATEYDFTPAGATFPFGAHVSVVEVDADTGRVTVRRHVAVDDCGRIVNPMLVDGQVHGGLASGISQALFEEFVYDADGNPLTSTFAEYAIPSAAEFGAWDVAHTETLSPMNPLGAKGIGESATVGSTPAVQNAVVDALSHLGVRHLDMPLTPERVWRALRDAEAGNSAAVWREPPAGFSRLPVRERRELTEDEQIDI